MESPKVTVVGAGLAGCEVAYQLAERGIAVELREMKPQKRTPAQQSDSFSELVCSNSFRGASLTNAVGLLKEEMRRRGSLVMKVGDATAVPAGGAMAVDRERFAAEMTRAIEAHPRIHVVPGEVTSVPEGRPCVIATGPLTAEALADDLAAKMGQGGLAYYDAIAPIVAAHSIDWDKVFRGSRYGKGQAPPSAEASAADGEAAKTSACESESGRGDAGRGTDNTEGGDDAYVNCPFEKDEYFAFVRALVEAEKVEARSFEDVKYFEGCLPCEVMAERGERTLSFGPMKPVGLVDPRTGRRPYAVIQLRQEDEHMSAYNLVGFQTRMKHGEQLRVFRTVPGLENAEFMRLGSVHRNTFVDAPNVLDGTMQLKALPGVYLAGQITGVEGYVESAASGLVCAMLLADTLAGTSPRIPPMTTALGALLGHLSRAPIGKAKYQPSNITWALFPPLEGINPRTKKRDRYELMAARALRDFEALA